MPDYAWIVERARSGEPVALETTRPDFRDIIDYLAEMTDGTGLCLQVDTPYGLLWVCRDDQRERGARP